MLRSKRVWLNSISSIVETLALPLLMAIATPYFISKLGMATYGIWALVNSVVMGMAVLNVGGADAIIKYVAEYRGKSKVKDITALVDSVLKIHLFLVFLVVGISVLVYGSEELPFTAHMEVNEAKVFSSALAFAVVIFALKLLENNLLSIYKAYEKFYVAAPISVLSRSGYVAVQIWSVSAGEDLTAVFQYAMYFSIISIFIQVLLLKKTFPWILFNSQFDFSPVKGIMPFLKWTWLTSIVAVASSQMDRWVLAALSTMEMVGLYSLVILIFINLHAVTSSSVAWLYPVISRLENGDNLRRMSYYLTCIVTGLSILGVLFLHLIEPVFAIWLGDELFKDAWIYISHMLWMLPIFAVSIPAYYIVKGRGLVRYVFIGDFVSMVLRLILVYFLFERFGLLGVVYAMALSGVFISLYYIYMAYSKNRDSSTILPYVVLGWVVGQFLVMSMVNGY